MEVMGREHGFLALSVGLASGAEMILVPEISQNTNKLCDELRKEHIRGKNSVIIVFAEGAGSSYDLADKVNKDINLEARVSSLGYIQRGGSPSAHSRILASQFGDYAVKLLLRGQKNRLVVIKNGVIKSIPLSTATRKEKILDLSMYDLAIKLATYTFRCSE